MAPRLCTLLLGILLAFACGFASPARASEWRDHSPHKSGFVQVNGLRLHYLDWGGHGEPMLFLNGWGDTAHCFDDLAPKFRDHFHIPQPTEMDDAD